MNRLFPAPLAEVSAADAVMANRPTPADRPWVMLNMISSVDGAAALDGLSGGLGGDADRALFHQMRGIADVIIAASGTVKAENYGPARPSEEVRRARRERGQAETPPIAVISGSLSFQWDTPFFTDAESRPIVMTHEGAPVERVRAAREHADVISCGQDAVDFPAAFAALKERGYSVALLEGGPSINHVLLEAGLVDELNLSFAPALVGGDPLRIIAGPAFAAVRALRLEQVVQDSDYLFLRYVASE